MTIILDSASPLESLEAQAIICTRTIEAGSDSSGGREAAGIEGASTHYRFALPSAPSLHFSLAPERFKHKLIKVFKRELQLGDPEFDPAVYIDTDDKERMAAFLAAESTRRLCLDIVGGGGRVLVDAKGIDVLFVEGASEKAEEELMAAMMVAAVLNFEPPPGR